ncbi:Protein-S-isoprenylcysteine O-methyltransferase, partial [Ophiophagus hannah]
MCSLSLFHYSEYLVTAVNNPRSLSLDSFLLNHSFEYNMAALSSWIEFTLRRAADGRAGRLPAQGGHADGRLEFQPHRPEREVGVAPAGDAGRVRLVPAPFVLLCNPVCLIGYTLVSWRFFRDRVEEEERALIHFFGEEYLAYKKKVPSGLPFIRGFRIGL